MKKLKFKKIDAFASEYSSGNPAGVIYLDRLEDLTEYEKLRIAKELKGFVNEVGFISHGNKTDYELCYYSSEREVAFCGHATIAILYDIIANNELLHSKKTLSISTRTEELKVENHYKEEKCVYISGPSPKFHDRGVKDSDIAIALNISISHINKSRPVSIINGGLDTLIVPIGGLDEILGVAPSPEKLGEFSLQNEVDIILLYSSEVTLPESQYRTRVFAPKFGYLEDPATGSGNSAFGYYLLSNDMWNGEKIKIEQNGLRNNPNFVSLFSRKTETEDLRVWFGGSGVTRIDGTYNLY